MSTIIIPIMKISIVNYQSGSGRSHSLDESNFYAMTGVLGIMKNSK